MQRCLLGVENVLLRQLADTFDGDGLRFDANAVDVMNRCFALAGVTKFCLGVNGVLNKARFGVWCFWNKLIVVLVKIYGYVCRS